MKMQLKVAPTRGATEDFGIADHDGLAGITDLRVDDGAGDNLCTDPNGIANGQGQEWSVCSWHDRGRLPLVQ